MPTTLGRTSISGCTLVAAETQLNTMILAPVSITNSGSSAVTIASISMWLGFANLDGESYPAGSNQTLALYDNTGSGGAPGALLAAVGVNVSGTVGGWVTGNLATGYSLAAGATVWIAVYGNIPDSGGAVQTYQGTAGTPQAYYGGGPPLSGSYPSGGGTSAMPSTFPLAYGGAWGGHSDLAAYVTLASTQTLSITSPATGAVLQRNAVGNNTGGTKTLTIQGGWTAPPPSSVNVTFQGTSLTTSNFSASSGGTWSVQVAVPAGKGTLAVTDPTNGGTASITVACGDVLVPFGDSLCGGMVSSDFSYTGSQGSMMFKAASGYGFGGSHGLPRRPLVLADAGRSDGR